MRRRPRRLDRPDPPRRPPGVRYDYRNQMVEYEDPDTLNVWRFAYDALGRRVLRSGPSGTTAYVNGGQASWQVLAEFDGVTAAANLRATYVYGNYIDEPIVMSRDFDGAGAGQVQHFYFDHDDLLNLVAKEVVRHEPALAARWGRAAPCSARASSDERSTICSTSSSSIQGRAAIFSRSCAGNADPRRS